jgi:hypothetical protein
LTGSTNKKVIIQRFEREPLKGFVNPQTSLLANGVELLSVRGTVTMVPYEEVKAVCFVRDFEAEDPRGDRRLFTARPKTEGLWVRMLFRDGDFLDGLLANDLLRLQSHGFTIVPPDPSSNSQRVFIPKAALAELKVLGVIGSPLRRRKRPPADKDQIRLFD